MRVFDNFEAGLALDPGAPVLIESASGQGASYAETDAFTSRFAHAVRQKGYGPEAKIAIISHNDVLMFQVVLGVLRSDAVWLPISSRSGHGETAELLERFDCTVLFYEEEAAPIVDILRDRDIAVDAVPLDHRSVEEWIGTVPAQPFQQVAEEDAIYAIQATGGTTGTPKAVTFSHRNARYIVTAFRSVCPFVPTERTPRPVFLANAPLTHAAGQVMQLILSQGGAGVTVPSARPADLLALIERYRITHMFLPPTVIYGLLEEPSLGQHDYSSLQYMIYGAAPMAPDKLAQAVRAFGPVLAQLYGQTETGVPNVFMTPADHFRGGDPANGLADHARLSSAGTPTPGTDLVILDEDGAVLPRGETGEIGIDCDGVTPGYYRDAQATRAAKAGRFHRTGDIAFIDDEGFVHIVDRKRDVIITGGFNVYSAEVERHIMSVPGVQECAVIGIPDAKWGEAVTAVLELVPGAQVDIDELRRSCKRELGSVKTPKEFLVVDTLPKSAAGKVLKRQIREEYWRDQERRVG